MKPTDTTHTPDGILPTPGSYPLYEYPAYTFDRKYENDEFQKKVITLDSGYHLVLAPPGCGKTDILAERVVRALSCGVSLDDMLCLTFTNRAARGMRSRILERLQASGEMSLFVASLTTTWWHVIPPSLTSRNLCLLWLPFSAGMKVPWTAMATSVFLPMPSSCSTLVI